MNISEKLNAQLTEVLSGAPWHGPSVYGILEPISFEAAYEKPPGSVHNIAELVLHMIAWTEEVIDRMNGKTASDPASGDWPETGAPDEKKWQDYVSDLKLVNVNLQYAIQNFDPQKWNVKIDDNRGYEPIATYEEMVRGLIDHHIYHSGQISILNRIING
jgi:uncharacterized damage-inducible protein DinB